MRFAAFPSVSSAILARAREEPSTPAFTWCGEEGEERQSTREQILERANGVARHLGELVKPGERAVLLYSPGVDFIVAFVGCLLAGIVAVPAYPPDPARLDRSLPRFRAILSDARAKLILTTSDLQALLPMFAPQIPELQAMDLLATDVLPKEGLSDTRLSHDIGRNSTCFLQYTSGSTSSPKGVVLTHDNILENIAGAMDAFALPPGARVVSWLPQFHDMGLIGCILAPLIMGYPTWLLSPITFLKKPIRWLELITRVKAHASGGPNFAYELCARRVRDEDLQRLDLSTWKVAFSGAEPVRSSTLRGFADKFGPSGFRFSAFLPCYGLAESTLFVSGRSLSEGPKTMARQGDVVSDDFASAKTSERPLLSCGPIASNHDVRIVDPQTRAPVSAGHIGEIWVHGPSVATGYFENPELTRATFEARLSNDPSAGPFLRTGDLGALVRDELVVAGRLKDLIIVRGTNHYPQDIELTVEEAAPGAIRPGNVAAFAIEHCDEERLCIVADAEISADAAEPVIQAIRTAILDRHDIAAAMIVLTKKGSVPKTSSGKIQRRKSKELCLEGGFEVIASFRESKEGSRNELSPPKDRVALRSWIAHWISDWTGVELGRIDDSAPFSQYGLDSRAIVEFSGDLEAYLGRSVSHVEVYNNPSVGRLVEHLVPSRAQENKAEATRAAQGEPLAIVGIGVRFPGADTPEALWDLLITGKEAIRNADGVRSNRLPFEAGFIERIDEFDAAFFGVSGREALWMDPQQRHLLEVTFEALEDAGIPLGSLEGSNTGVFVGISGFDYALLTLEHRKGHQATGNAHSIAANRISYTFDLRGPSISVDTACSSSLSALHLAAHSIWRGETELAIVGGANLLLSPTTTATLVDGGFLSKTGRCSAFGEAADGYVRGEGFGAIVVKPLSRAVADRDRIYCTLLATSQNQDGRTAGLSAPSGAAQIEVLKNAYGLAGLSSDAVQYVEAHGTGTPLGDPIEAAALGDVLGRGRTRPLRIGSIKSNIGHLEAAAGIAGVIKLALSIYHRELAPTLNVRAANPRIPLSRLGLELQRERSEWPMPHRPLIGGVSSFGFGGTNVHAVLAEAPISGSLEDRPSLGPMLLPLSANDPKALATWLERFRVHLQAEAGKSLEDLSHTLSQRRTHHDYRMALTVSGMNELKALIAAPDLYQRAVRKLHSPQVVFVCSGQGGQWPGMGLSLLEAEQPFARRFHECEAQVLACAGFSLVESLREYARGKSLPIDRMQPILFAMTLSLAATLEHYGVVPHAVVGQSLGEVAAACISGALTIADAVLVVCTRSRLLTQLRGGGAMLATNLSMLEAEALLASSARGLSIAAENGDRAIVFAGAEDSIRALAGELEQKGCFARMINVDVASHSAQVDPILEELSHSLAGLAPVDPTTALLSTVLMRKVRGKDIGAEYWKRNLREPVRFGPVVRQLAEQGPTVFVELSAHPVLANSSAEAFSGDDVRVVGTLRKSMEEHTAIVDCLGRLFESGVELDWRKLSPSRKFVDLPGYAWQKRSFWPEHIYAGSNAAAATIGDPPDETSLRSDLYRLKWEPSDQKTPLGGTPRVLVFETAEMKLSAQLPRHLETQGVDVGALRNAADPKAVFRGLLNNAEPPEHIVFGWGLTASGAASTAESVDAYFVRSVGALRGLLQALSELAWTPRIFVVTARSQAVVGGDSNAPLQSALWGYVRSVRHEHPEFNCTLVDLEDERDASRLTTLGGEDEVAFRKGQMFVARLSRADLKSSAALQCKASATYVVTGGTGGLGIEASRWLAARGARNILLVGRNEPNGQCLSGMKKLQDMGVNVQFARADIAERQDVCAMFDTIPKECPVDGVVHAAGVLEDGFVMRQTHESFRKVIAPKILGAMNIVDVLGDTPLSFFIHFSSATGVLGSPGQSSYSAANAFLDALSLGSKLPMISVGWGPFAEVGMAARGENRGARLAQMGFAPLAPSTALSILDNLAADPNTTMMVLKADWARCAAAMAGLRDSSVLRELLRTREGSDQFSAIGAELRNGSRSLLERKGLLVDHIRTVVGETLREHPSAIDVQRPLVQLGIDSLMALDIKNRIERITGLRVHLSTLIRGPAITTIAQDLLGQLAEQPTDAGGFEEGEI